MKDRLQNLNLKLHRLAPFLVVHFLTAVLSTFIIAFIWADGMPIAMLFGLLGTSIYLGDVLFGGVLPAGGVMLLPLFWFLLGVLSMRSRTAFWLAVSANIVNIILSWMYFMDLVRNGLFR
jgi:hypothetical protein